MRHSFLLASLLFCGRLWLDSQRFLQEILVTESTAAYNDLQMLLPNEPRRREDDVIDDGKLAFMPMPFQVSLSEDQFVIIDTNFQVQIVENGWNQERLLRAATRFIARLSGRTGLFLKHNLPITQYNKDGKFNFDLKKLAPILVIRCNRIGKETELGDDESYSIQITSTQVILEAETDLGALHGLETLLQLISVDNFGSFYIWSTGSIQDKPRFPWRGLLLDASRHFMPVHVIERNLDAMAAVKLNVLHWHLTDDQGFRVECLAYPKLHQNGSDRQYYTQSEVRSIVEFAAERGIRVVPEFDIPGHATSWLVGYPELGSAPGPFEIDRNWGISEHVMDPSNEHVYVFLQRFFNEMATLFPDPFVHIGGDEVKINEWNESATIHHFMHDHNISSAPELQAYFNNRIAAILQQEGKNMIGWDEILHPNMPRTTLIQSWRGSDAMIQAVQQGYRSILSNGYYIDLCLPAEAHYQNDPLPFDVNLTQEEQKLVLGGEAAMWSEFVGPETVDSRIWPRTAAIAERLWSPQHISDVDDMYRRLDIVSYQLEELGLTHLKNYEMMLRRLVRGSDITPLKTLVDVLEPVQGYQRRQQREHTFFSPLTRVVDAARPDAPVARKFRLLVHEFLQLDPVNRADTNNSVRTELVEWLTLWHGNHRKLAISIARFPVLQEIEQLSVTLTDLATVGLKAMAGFRSPNEKTHWNAEERAIIEHARNAQGQTLLAVTFSIRQLMISAGQRRRDGFGRR